MHQVTLTYEDIPPPYSDMAEMGFTTFRFGTCWSRIFPTGLETELKQEGLDFYEAVVDELNAHGIALLITICHDEMPLELIERYNGADLSV